MVREEVELILRVTKTGQLSLYKIESILIIVMSVLCDVGRVGSE